MGRSGEDRVFVLIELAGVLVFALFKNSNRRNFNHRFTQIYADFPEKLSGVFYSAVICTANSENRSFSGRFLTTDYADRSAPDKATAMEPSFPAGRLTRPPTPI